MVKNIIETIIVEGIMATLKKAWEKIKDGFVKNRIADTKLDKTVDARQEEPQQLDSVGKYISYSRQRNKFNKIFLSTVEIKYTFRDNEEDENVVSVDVEYLFSGNINEKPMRYLQTYLSLREYNENNISMEAFDIYAGQAVVPRIEKEDNDGLEYGDNGAYWRIPFYGGERRYMDTVKTKLKLSWKRFSPKNKIDPFIIDPRNYAENANIGKMEIRVVNDTRDYKINNIEMCEYNRETNELFDDNSKYSIYDLIDSKKNSKELLCKTIIRKEIDKDKIFVLRCK